MSISRSATRRDEDGGDEMGDGQTQTKCPMRWHFVSMYLVAAGGATTRAETRSSITHPILRRLSSLNGLFVMSRTDCTPSALSTCGTGV